MQFYLLLFPPVKNLFRISTIKDLKKGVQPAHYFEKIQGMINKGEHMAPDKKISTDELLALLFKERNIEQFLQRDESSFLLPSFSEYMTDWCIQHDEVPESVILRANLDKSYGHQLFSGKRNPSRDTVLQLAFAIRADLPQVQEMLKIARKSILYPRVKRDTVIIYCLHNGISLTDTEIILYDLGLPLLGGKDR